MTHSMGSTDVQRRIIIEGESGRLTYKETYRGAVLGFRPGKSHILYMGGGRFVLIMRRKGCEL